MDDEVFEMHGLWTSGGKDQKEAPAQWVDVRDMDNGRIMLTHTDQFRWPRMTTGEARYLAYKLLRLARRIENRNEG